MPVNVTVNVQVIGQPPATTRFCWRAWLASPLRLRQFFLVREVSLYQTIIVDEDEDDEEDFFTGESDNDFVSLSSGSNSRRAPRKSWTCEHCTYVNNPGVSVCAMCCRTSNLSEFLINSERASSRNSNRYSLGQRCSPIPYFI